MPSMEKFGRGGDFMEKSLSTDFKVSEPVGETYKESYFRLSEADHDWRKVDELLSSLEHGDLRPDEALRFFGWANEIGGEEAFSEDNA
jgi:hypothetical protein